jgi:Domain of unknown function (DUF4082)
MAVYTLFGQPASPASLITDPSSYTFGIQFSVSQSGTLSAIWFYSAPGAASLPQDITLYAVSGQTLVHQETASWSGAAASGWVRAAFTSPPSLTSGTSYKGTVSATSTLGSWYSATSHYWDTGAGQNGISNGPLSAPNNAGGDGGQDTFNTSLSPAYPATSFNATNYWMDVEVTVQSAAVTPPQLYVSRTELIARAAGRVIRR